MASTEKKWRETRHESLKSLTKTVLGWRKEFKTKEEVELRRQVRWSQERVNRETIGARHMEFIFTELIEGTSMAVAPGGGLVKDMGK